jgi:hypothetical protein
MPQPVYCTRTKRPLYTAELAALCVRIRETNVGLDGRYVIFYARSNEPASAEKQPKAAALSRRASVDTLTQEMIDTLKAMGVRIGEEEVASAIRQQCPSGVSEATFESDLRAVFDRIRSRDVD